MLIAVHRRRWLEFTSQFCNWTLTDWWQVTFFDESHFTFHGIVGGWCIRVKFRKAITLQQLPERSKLKKEVLWSGECFHGIVWVHLSMWKALRNNTSTNLFLWTISTPTCELVFPRTMTFTSRTMPHIIQITVHERGSKSTRMLLPHSSGRQTPLI